FGPLSKQGWRRWLGQSAVRSLARRLTTSILLMRGRPNTLRRALLCTAGGQEVLGDARMTAGLLGPLGGEATILHIVSQMPLMFSRDEGNDDQLSGAVLAENSAISRNIDAAKELLGKHGVAS